MVLGGRDDATCRNLLDKVGMSGKTFVTDDWEGYHRVIPQGQLFTGKDLTFPIEQDNSNVRHCLARFRRRTKVVSKCRTMVDLSLRLLHHLQHPTIFASYAKQLATIFALIPAGVCFELRSDRLQAKNRGATLHHGDDGKASA